ncbi:MAG: hypothetical protein KDA53_15955 [Hyphomonas sp.]|nr:hypothetical protein [Hyphomonas sp.]
MRLITVGILAASFGALPALAGSTTWEFTDADGTVSVVVLGPDGTATMDGSDPIPYTLDANTLCGETPEGEICATFDAIGDEVGFSTGYTNSEGVTGTATITAKD